MQIIVRRCLGLKHSDQPLRLYVGQFDGKALPLLGYVSQLLFPPPQHCRTEVSAILQALKLVGNSMLCEAAYRLKVVGVSPTWHSVYMESSTIRAARKTSQGFEGMTARLSEKARESSSSAIAISPIIFLDGTL